MRRILSCPSKSPKFPPLLSRYLRQCPVGTALPAKVAASDHRTNFERELCPICSHRSEMRMQAQIIAQIRSSRPATRKSTHPVLTRSTSHAETQFRPTALTDTLQHSTVHTLAAAAPHLRNAVRYAIRYAVRMPSREKWVPMQEEHEKRFCICNKSPFATCRLECGTVGIREAARQTRWGFLASKL